MENYGQCPDKSRFEEIYNRYYRFVYNYAYGKLRHQQHAEDIASTVFTAVYMHLSRWDASRGSISPWILAIARNAVLDHWRRSSVRREMASGLLNSVVSENPSAAMKRGRLMETRMSSLWHLSREEREFLAFRYTLDFSDREIAAMLDCCEYEIHRRYRRFISVIRKSVVYLTTGKEHDDSLEDPENPVIRRILRQLKPRERKLLAFRYVRRLSNKEIALIIGISDSGVSKRFQRLFEKLRKLA